jgi:hypothetical protein
LVIGKGGVEEGEGGGRRKIMQFSKGKREKNFGEKLFELERVHCTLL